MDCGKDETKIRISGLIITKNEQKDIARCINSLLPVVDEMIVVDTGSTDATVEIALELGAEVKKFVWVDDFSAARNFAVEQVSGDWIIFLDADQWFDSDSVPKVRSLIEKTHPDSMQNMLMTKEINYYDETNSANTMTNKIFRNRPDIRFRGNIHEQNYIGDKYLTGVYYDDIVIHHDGFIKKKMADKSGRNLRLLERNLVAGNIGDYTYLMLANEYLCLGKKDKAFAFANLQKKKDIERNLGYTLAVRSPVIIIEYMYNNPGKFSDAQILMEINSAAQRFPDHPEIIYWKALYFRRKGERELALNLFLQTIQMNDVYSGNQWLDFMPKEGSIYWNVACLFAETEQPAQSVAFLIKYLKKYKEDKGILEWLVRLANEQKFLLRDILKKIYDFDDENDKKIIEDYLKFFQ